MRTRFAGKIAMSILLSGTCLTVVSDPLAAAGQEVQEAEEHIEFFAEDLSYDADTGLVTAVGNVVAGRNGYRLRAGRVTYSEKTGEIHASDGISITSPDGDTIHAPSATLDQDLQDVVVENIRLILADGSQVAALKAYRQDGETGLERAAYSPCKVCDGNGNPKQPLWQIKAVKVTHDGKKRRLYYDNARLELLGVPILWLPWFSHPDPSVDRASGFLPVSFRHRQELGLVLEMPYHHVFSPSSDLTLTPILTTREGAVLAGEYRRHLGKGEITAGGSITRTDERDDNNNRTGSNEFRGHIETDGYLNHSKNWRSRLQINWTSDDTYLRRYDFSDADALTSQYAFEGFFDRSYIGARTVAFQGLRVEDVPGLTGHALPLIDAEFVPKIKPLGGTLSFRGNALALHRTDGMDTQRLSVSGGWTRRNIFASGLVMDNDALVRADFYNINDSDRPDDAAFGGVEGSHNREMARLSTTFSMPFIKYRPDGYQIIEPILQVVLAPSTGNVDNLVNEDSRAFELSGLNMFSPERASGFDLWENGSRLTYGGRWKHKGKNLKAEVMLGHSWRFSGRNLFAEGSGIEEDAADFVARSKLEWKEWLKLENRIRLDQKSADIKRNEIYLGITRPRFGFDIGYLKLDRDMTFINREDREEIRGTAYINVNSNWRLDGHVIQDLSNGWDGVEYGAGVTYLDECFEFSLQFRERFTTDRDIRPGTSVFFRINLKNLGGN